MITIKRNMKAFNEFKFEAKWTLGKILAVQKALELYALRSPVGKDVLDELNYEFENKKLESIQL